MFSSIQEKIVDNDIVTVKTTHWSSEGGIIDAETGREPYEDDIAPM